MNANKAGFSDETQELSQSSFSLSSFGVNGNVELTQEEFRSLQERFERSGDLIDKVSVWLRSAENHVPDHYGLCVRFADRESWPRRRVIEPVEEITVEDPLEPEEQRAKVLEMKSILNGAFASG